MITNLTSFFQSMCWCLWWKVWDQISCQMYRRSIMHYGLPNQMWHCWLFTKVPTSSCFKVPSRNKMPQDSENYLSTFQKGKMWQDKSAGRSNIVLSSKNRNRRAVRTGWGIRTRALLIFGAASSCAPPIFSGNFGTDLMGASPKFDTFLRPWIVTRLLTDFWNHLWFEYLQLWQNSSNVPLLDKYLLYT